MTYIYQRSFTKPTPERTYSDGRDKALEAIRKAHSSNARPDLLVKRSVPLNKAAGSAAAVLKDIRKIHREGRRAGIPTHEAQGTPPFASRSIAAVKKALGRGLHIDGHRLLSARELNKAFAETGLTNPSISAADLARIVNSSTRDGSNMHLSTAEMRKANLAKRDLPAALWNAMTWNERRDYFQKGLTPPRLLSPSSAPQNANGQWNDTTASNTGATRAGARDPVPQQRTSRVGDQSTTTPSMTDRDAAIAAIRKDLLRPKRLTHGGIAADLDEDDSDMDLDEDDDTQKDPNAHDYGNKRKARRDEDEDED